MARHKYLLSLIRLLRKHLLIVLYVNEVGVSLKSPQTIALCGDWAMAAATVCACEPRFIYASFSLPTMFSTVLVFAFVLFSFGVAIS